MTTQDAERHDALPQRVIRGRAMRLDRVNES
jgi:hypothetical protein